MLRHIKVTFEHEVNSYISIARLRSRRCESLKIVYLKSFHPPSAPTTPLTQLLNWARCSYFLGKMEDIVAIIDNREQEIDDTSDKTEDSEEIQAEELNAETYV